MIVNFAAPKKKRPRLRLLAGGVDVCVRKLSLLWLNFCTRKLRNRYANSNPGRSLGDGMTPKMARRGLFRCEIGGAQQRPIHCARQHRLMLQPAQRHLRVEHGAVEQQVGAQLQCAAA